MLKSGKLSGTILLLIGIAAGGLVFSNFGSPNERVAYSTPALPNTDVIPARDRAVRSLRDINDAFVELAEAVNPTVVTVFTEKKVRVSDRHFFQIPSKNFLVMVFSPVPIVNVAVVHLIANTASKDLVQESLSRRMVIL